MNFYFSPNGRVSLGQYWQRFLIPYWAISIILAYVDIHFLGKGVFVPGQPMILTGLFGLMAFWPSIAVVVKRFHDHNMSGWMIIPAGLSFWIGAMCLIFALVGSIKGAPSGNSILVLFGIGAMLVSMWLNGLISFFPGKKGPNSFGNDPRDPTSSPNADAYANAYAAIDRMAAAQYSSRPVQAQPTYDDPHSAKSNSAPTRRQNENARELTRARPQFGRRQIRPAP